MSSYSHLFGTFDPFLCCLSDHKIIICLLVTWWNAFYKDHIFLIFFQHISGYILPVMGFWRNIITKGKSWQQHQLGMKDCSHIYWSSYTKKSKPVCLAISGFEVFCWMGVAYMCTHKSYMANGYVLKFQSYIEHCMS